jgi:hypothetical protein
LALRNNAIDFSREFGVIGDMPTKNIADTDVNEIVGGA